MMKKLFLIGLFAFLQLQFVNAQVFYTETFDGTPCAATSGCDQSLVGWGLTVTGAEGSSPNSFFVSCQENGNAAGACGSGCGSDQSLHIGNISTSPAAPFWCPSGDCGASYDASAGCETNRRAESPTINCSAASNITIDFVYMENGEGANDDASLWYFDGTTWALLDALPKTALGCSPQGTWTAFTAALPASADGNPNVKIGFKWINNGNNVGTDPSFAVDDITLTSTPPSGPTANYSFTPSTICAGDLVTFTNTSTGGPFTSANWTFVGGTPNFSTSLGTATTTWSTPGTYAVVLIVNTVSGADTVAGTITVISCASPPVASFTISASPICEGDCISFTNTSTSSAASFTSAWTFTGAVPSSSTSTNPSGVCYATAGSYPVMLIVTDVNGSDTSTAIVTVTTCATAPTANFSAPDTICRGDCLNFTDLSTGVPTSWSWSFSGATPATSTSQNPTSICYNAVGTYAVTLTATNGMGSDNYTETIVVVNCSAPVAAFNASSNSVCQGQCISVVNNSAFATSYSWSMPGANPSTSTDFEPLICYDSSGTFTITLTATNAFGNNTSTFNVTVDTIPIVEAFPDIVGISLGDSTMLTVTANGSVDYAWVTTDTASIGDTTLASVMVTPTAPGTIVYYVYATGGNGCYGIDSVIVEVYLTDVIGVPNAFSPNADGFNDELKVLGPGIKTMNFIVYNRYGQQVFSSTDQAKGWDGRFNGKALDPGVFGWYLEYSLENGSTGKQKGNTTLIK